MKQNQKYKMISIVILIIAVLGLSVAYATFSSILTFNGTLKADGKWQITWDNLQSGSRTGYAVLGSLSIDSSKESVTGVIGTLVGQGDTITWTWDVKNDGNIDAKLFDFNNIQLKCSVSNINPGHTATAQQANDVCKQLKLEFTYGGVSLDNFNPNNYQILKGGKSIPVSMTLSYSASSNVELSGPIEVSFVDRPTFIFAQAEVS